MLNVQYICTYKRRNSNNSIIDKCMLGPSPASLMSYVPSTFVRLLAAIVMYNLFDKFQSNMLQIRYIYLPPFTMQLKCSSIFYAIMSKYKCPGLVGHGRDSGLGSTPCSLFSSKSDWNRTAYKRVNYNAAVAIGQFHSTQVLSLLPKHSFRDSLQVGPQVDTTSWLIMPKCVHTWATLGPHWGTQVCTHLHLM